MARSTACSLWDEYREACELMLSAMAAYANTKDQAFAFRSWSAWRIAADLQPDALEEYRSTFARFRDPARVANEAVATERERFRLCQQALFQMLDEVAEKNFDPSKAAQTAVVRYNVGVLMGAEMRRRLHVGTDQQALLIEVARRMSLSAVNTRKLFEQFLGETGLTTTSNDVMAALRKLKPRRSQKEGARGKRLQRSRKPTAWAK